MLALACVFAVPGASAGWIQVPPKRPCPALPDGYVCSTTTQIRFGYPATWGALTSSDGGFVRSMIWLSTEPFHKPCTSTTEGERTTVVCGSPVSSLRPNGVLVSWRMGGTSSFNLDALPGIPAMIGGGSARIALLSNGMLFEGCRKLGGDEAILTWAARPRGGFYGLSACLRGPDLARSETEVATVLASARFPAG